MRSTVRLARLASDAWDLPPTQRARGTSLAVLSAALQLFAKRGFGGTSVRDVAAEADVQPATMYAHYPSKQHLLAELIRVGHEEHLRRLRAALLDCGADSVEQLTALVAAHVRMHCDYPMLAVVANAELHSLAEEFAGESLSLRRQSEQLFMDVLTRGIERGSFSVPAPWLALSAIGGMGLRVAHWYTPECGMTVDDIVATYAEFARRLVGVKAVAEP